MTAAWLSPEFPAASIASFLLLDDVYRLGRVSRSGLGALFRSRKARRAAGGLPFGLRPQFWKSCLGVETFKAEICAAPYPGLSLLRATSSSSSLRSSSEGKEPHALTSPSLERKASLGGGHRSFYGCLRDSIETRQASECSAAAGVWGEIDRDVGRTFPKNEAFQDGAPGQRMLSRVLKAIAVQVPDVGYCQGMGFVAGCFLLESLRSRGIAPHAAARDVAVAQSVEEEAFWLMYALTASRHKSSAGGSDLSMRELWLPGCPELKLRVFQFDALLKCHLPKVHQHFRSIDLQLEILVTQWFLTLFSYSLPFNVLIRAWDIIFMDGWKAVFRMGLARLMAKERRLIELDIEEMPAFLKEFRLLSGASEGEACRLIAESSKIKITRSALTQLQGDFAMVLLKEHLKGGEGEWLERYGSPKSGLAMQHPTGVEAVVRMMLIDEELVRRLRGELDVYKASVAADADCFVKKIHAASDRAALANDAYEESALALSYLAIELEDAEERIELLISQMQAATDPTTVLGPAQTEEAGRGETVWPDAAGNELEPSNSSSLGIGSSTRASVRLLPRLWSALGLGSAKKSVSKQSDVELLKAKVAEAQSDLNDLHSKYVHLASHCELVRVEAAEADELKCAYSTQMVQLLLEQESQIDGTLRLYAVGDVGA